MTLTINWNTLSIDDWDRAFASVPYSNILQSYDYARAASPILKQKPHWGLIQIAGADAGIVQIFETGILWNSLHTVTVDRGPLWFDGFGGALHIKLFFDEMNRLFPQRFGRKRRFLPNIEDGPTARKLIAQTGLLRLEDRKGHETVWASPQASLQNSDVSIKVDTKGELIEWATGIYAVDKGIRNAKGMSPALFKSYAALLAGRNNLIILQAEKDDKPVGFAAVVVHGRSATYLIGWAADESVRPLLVAQALAELSVRGIQEFDLGGLGNEGWANDNGFKFVSDGRIVRYVGHYC